MKLVELRECLCHRAEEVKGEVWGMQERNVFIEANGESSVKFVPLMELPSTGVKSEIRFH